MQLPRQLNSGAEAYLVGAMLLDSEGVLAQSGVASLRPESFHISGWGAVWEVVQGLAAEKRVIDHVTVANELRRRRQLDDVGGAAALADAMATCPSVQDASAYAGAILEWHWRRRLQRAAFLLIVAICRGEYREAARATADVCDGVLRWKAGRANYSSMGDIQEFHGAVTWAWPSWIPVGHLTLIAGPQACGKSYLAARLIANLTGCVRQWPDGAAVRSGDRYCLPAKVLLIETEEMRGAYADRLARMGVGDEWVLFGPGNETHIPDLVREAGRVEQLVRDHSLGAIVIDSLSGGHLMKEESTDMRVLLRAYAKMAGELHVPVIMVHHTRKRGAREPASVTLDRVRGSTTITQFCRSVIALYRQSDGDQASAVRVEAIKSTFCAPPKPFGFTITDEGLRIGDAPGHVRTLTQWERARDLIVSALGEGPTQATVIERVAEAAGVSERTLRRAKKALGVRAIRRSCREDGETVVRWFWELPDDGQGACGDDDVP